MRQPWYIKVVGCSENTKEDTFYTLSEAEFRKIEVDIGLYPLTKLGCAT